MGTLRPDTPSSSTCPGLFGSGLVTDSAGDPLGPCGPDLTGELLDQAGFRPGDRVIDVGCGQGRGVGLMASRGLRAMGIDADLEPLRVAQQRLSDATFLKARGDRLPFPDGAVDGVLSECALSVMSDRTKALTEWNRVLRKGGHLAFSDVYARHPDPGGETPVGHGAVISAERLRRVISTTGFAITCFEDRSDLLRAWAGRFIFKYGSLDALWGDAATAKVMRRIAPGYCVIIAVKPAHGEPTDP